MIEVMYDKQEQTNDNYCYGIDLPKNIRQIGNPMGNRRIYIEDYVMTYLKQLAGPNSSYARGAILVGECVKGLYGEVIYISGALAAQNLELDLDETCFDGETWSYIYQDVKHYFPDYEVVGWFLSRMGFSVELNDIIVRLHMDNFAGSDKVLFIMDSLEGEDAIYLPENEGLRKQEGYYIYYVRNEAMQSFMIETRKEIEKEEQDTVEKKDEAVMKNYRKIMEERARQARIEKGNKRLSFMCYVLSIAILGLGVAVLSNYRMIDKVKGELNNRILAEKLNEIQEGMDGTEIIDLTQSEKIDVKPKTVPTAGKTVPHYYTVQSGDTLSSISFKMYNSVGYVADLMKANELEEMDEIREGDRILIPTVEGINR